LALLRRRVGAFALRHGPTLVGVVVAVLALALSSASQSWRVAETDWSAALVLSRRPEPAELSWGYQAAFYLAGLYQVTRRGEEPLSVAMRERYWRDLDDWALAHVEPDGSLVDHGRPVQLDALDRVMPGLILIRLHDAGRDPDGRFLKAVVLLRDRLRAWPRLAGDSSGAFVHTTAHQGQIWSDGAYMSTAFLLALATAERDRTALDEGWALDEAANQLGRYAQALMDPVSGLPFHGFDAARSADWARPDGRSPWIWCRSVGWFGMSLVDVLLALDHLPPADPRRARMAELRPILQRLVNGLVDGRQDPRSGRWLNVMNLAHDPANYGETSCSAMHAFVIGRAVQRGWVDRGLLPAAVAAYRGVTGQLQLDVWSRYYLPDVVSGTRVMRQAADYLAVPHDDPDNLHGLGAFLRMSELFRSLCRRGGPTSTRGCGDGSSLALLAAGPPPS
jgi:unsaturated rhamnogalacturonyl hydrolase